MKYFLLFLLFTYQNLSAQEIKGEGLQFEDALTWQQVKAKAAAENKYIFIDAWTTWCSPCIVMNNKVFPLNDVGAFYNKNFINVKLQLDTSAKDSDYVKSWYTDAHNLMKEWDIQLFPTFLFLSPAGELVHRGVGGSDGATFIALGKDALDAKTQFYTLKKKYEAGEKDAALLYALAKASSRAAFDELAKAVAKEYLATQKNLFTKENLVLLRSTIRQTTDDGFELFLNHGKKVDAALGKGEAISFVKNIIIYQHLYSGLYSDEGPVKNPDWKEAEKIIKMNIKNIRPDYLKTLLAAIKSDHLKQAKGGAHH